MRKYFNEFVTMSFDLLFFGMIGLFFHLVIGLSFIASVFAMMGTMFFMVIVYMFTAAYLEMKDAKAREERAIKVALKLAEIRQVNEEADAKYQEYLLTKRN